MEIRGLKNERENNCYLNVIIQAFWNLNEFRNELISIVHTHEDMHCITCQISVMITQNLFINMKYSGLQNFSIISLKKSLFSKMNKTFSNGHGCAAESFEEILNFMNSETVIAETSIIKSYFSITTQERGLYAREFEEIIGKQHSFDYHFDSLFVHALKNIEGTLFCSNCGNIIRAPQKILKFPKVLAFVIEWETRVICKKFLRTLRINLTLSKIKSEMTRKKHYLLRAIVCFRMSHYYCYVFYPRTNNWVLFDDTRTKKFMSLKQVYINIDENAGVPVMLFYEKTPEEIILLEHEENLLPDFGCTDCRLM